MKNKFLIVLLLLFFCICSLSAAVHHTVPVDSSAYRIVESAEGRGIIRVQSAVKPYTLSYMVKLLKEIRASDRITDSERETIDSLLAEFERKYGMTDNRGSKNIFTNGFFRTANAEKGMSLQIGLEGKTRQTPALTTTGEKYFDSRNSIAAYIRGDLFKAVSFDVNFGVLLDKLDPRAGNLTDFDFDCEGFYLRPWEGGRVLDKFPGSFYLGVAMRPELDVSLFDNVLDIRWASVKRDWGPGINNLALSSSAAPVDGIELRLHPFKWFEYNVMTGSLGKFSIKSDIPEITWASDTLHNNLYDNNFSIHRLELTPFKFFQIGLYESVIWKKRFELAYINPLSVYMFAQNSVGDYDNMLAGLDLTFSIPKFGKIYAGFAMDEMNSPNPKKWFTLARNIMGLQGGLKITPKLLSFSEITLQATYLPSFFGTHYTFYGSQNPWGSGAFSTAYVNKGRSLSYPVNPDTLELLVNLKTDLGKGWALNTTVKDQISSAQYAIGKSGNNILVPMEYDAVHYNATTKEEGSAITYSDRHFFKNLWRNVAVIDASIEKKFKNFPVTLTADFLWALTWKRNYSVNLVSDAYRKYTVDGETKYEKVDVNLGSDNTYSSWVKTPDVTFALALGASIYY